MNITEIIVYGGVSIMIGMMFIGSWIVLKK
jgi:hypothetical protein